MADRDGIRVSDTELNASFQNIAQNNQLSLEEFIETIESEGESYKDLREQVREEMIIQRVQRGRVGREVDITEQELNGFLATEGVINQLSPELFVRQILVSTENQALELIQKIHDGSDLSLIHI